MCYEFIALVEVVVIVVVVKVVIVVVVTKCWWGFGCRVEVVVAWNESLKLGNN